jgi:D-alanyl-D-alanine carboxypeptidase (penicillin-binding protein 5/6)
VILRPLPLLFSLACLLCPPAQAASAAVTAAPVASPREAGAAVPAPPALGARAWVMMDATTGAVISSQNPDERLPPASLTKLMTVYITTHELMAGRLRADDKVTVSDNAWRTGGSRMFITPSSQIRVDDLLHGVVIDSGNDAAVALAERIGGSEARFAIMMNQAAQRLGLSNTHFMNPTGLPIDDHYSSARDMALLARSIIRDEAAYYPLYANKYFTWGGIRQPNRNLLLWRDSSVDGLKTGHTDAAGYCMVTSAVRHGERLITAVFGSSSMATRASDTEALLTYGFRFFETATLQNGRAPLARPRLWKGRAESIAVGLANDLVMTLPRRDHEHFNAHVHLARALVAPLPAGSVVGSYEVFDGEDKLVSMPLVTLAPAPEGSWLHCLVDSLRMFFAAYA